MGNGVTVGRSRLVPACLAVVAAWLIAPVPAVEASTEPGTLSCRASALKVATFEPLVANDQLSPCVDGSAGMENGLSPIFRARSISATTDIAADGPVAIAKASATEVTIGKGASAIRVTALRSQVTASCAAGGVVLTPSGEVGQIYVGSARVRNITSGAYAEIRVGSVTIRLNHTIQSGDQLTYRALSIESPVLGVVHLGEATAGSVGNVCFTDTDGDTVGDDEDNCPGDFNPDQANNDGDAQGDACDPDDDNDGTADHLDCAPFDPNVDPNAADLPDLAFTDSNCDGIDGKLSDAIFVSPSGNDSATGTTPDSPKRSVNAALAQAVLSGRTQVLVEQGTFEEAGGAQLAGGRFVAGGYDPGFHSRSSATASLIVGSPQGAFADGVGGVTLQLLSVRGEPDSARSAYGVRAINGSALTLERVTVRAGGGADGAAGASGAAGAPGGNGQTGFNGNVDNDSAPGPGGSGGIGGGFNGGPGGRGGAASSFDGQPGGAGSGPSPGGGGAGAGDDGCTPRNGSPGGTGGSGAAGSNGAGGTDTIAGSGATWSGQIGGAGATGARGSGGGGGGGGSGQTGLFCVDGAGSGGGGGGAGGAGGQPGGGGAFGGGSFGIFLSESTASVIGGSDVLAGNGGNGGAGGNGGSGGAGGSGANGGCACDGDIGAGGRGGNGGAGGRGGAGGGGAGGPSVGIYRFGTADVTVSGSTVAAGAGGAGGAGGTGGNAGAAGVSQAILP